VPYSPNPGPESRFTAPNSECAHPDRWSSDDDDSTEFEVSQLVAGFVTALQPDYVIETGTAWGQTAEMIGARLRDNGQGMLVTLEPDTERCRYSAERCRGLPVRVMAQESMTWVPEQAIDFAWFDSLIPLRCAEFRYFRSWMHGSTVVGFHDTGPQHGLRPQIDVLASEGLLAPLYLPTPRGVCFARVLW
jgi:hypothetical protein